jgi:hypothetical protein
MWHPDERTFARFS